MDSLGIDNYGLPINVDNNGTPYNNTRQLITSYTVPLGDAHGSTIQDNKTPESLGVPVFLPVWTYMLSENITTGLSDNSVFNNSSLFISPNPTNGFVTLDLTKETYTISIYDQNGNKIKEKYSATGKYQIDCSDLNQGFYFIQAINDKKILTGKLIIQ
mgnify:CR=1 FL=1